MSGKGARNFFVRVNVFSEDHAKPVAKRGCAECHSCGMLGEVRVEEGCACSLRASEVHHCASALFSVRASQRGARACKESAGGIIEVREERPPDNLVEQEALHAAARCPRVTSTPLLLCR